MMAEDELALAALIRQRIANSDSRVDLVTADVPQVLGTATVDELAAAERELGFALPELLRWLYSEVANGGFGPGAGLLGVRGGHTDMDGRTISGSYLALRLHSWPQGVLPLCELGAGARSCVDRRDPNNSILTVDAAGMTRTSHTLFSWLYAWASGVDIEAETFEIQDGTMINPFTKRSHSIRHRGQAKGVWVEAFRK